eukprot:scaffold1723_cov144-Skeletonema_menzelii.AAC.8
MKIIVASFALVYATTSTAFASSHSCNDLDYSYPNDLPWVNYQGEDYIFTRQKYNSVCVDSHNREYEYGTIPGVYTPIDEAGGGCSTFCVEGTSSDSARGCNLRPPSNKLVGFQYDCESATCKCLYEAGTLNNQYSRCFDDMNTSNKGNGQVSGTKVQQGETCYSLHIQSTDPPVGGICTYEPDRDCYKSGHPQCCSVDGGANCPDYLTMCDNHAEGMSGTDYCTNSPEYQCYNTYNGHPSCCSETGGPFMNCPKTQPACDGASQYVKYLRSNNRDNFALLSWTILAIILEETTWVTFREAINWLLDQDPARINGHHTLEASRAIVDTIEDATGEWLDSIDHHDCMEALR